MMSFGGFGNPFSTLEQTVKEQCMEAVNSPELLEDVVENLEDLLATNDE